MNIIVKFEFNSGDIIYKTMPAKSLSDAGILVLNGTYFVFSRIEAGGARYVETGVLHV